MLNKPPYVSWLGLEGRTFFTTMLDPSLQCLSTLPGVPVLLAAFEQRLCQQVDAFATLALTKASTRQQEATELEQALATGIAEVNAEGAQLIDAFIDQKTEVRSEEADVVKGWQLMFMTIAILMTNALARRG